MVVEFIIKEKNLFQKNEHLFFKTENIKNFIKYYFIFFEGFNRKIINNRKSRRII